MDSLPTELVDRILCFCDRATLGRLSRSSWRLRGEALPLLWRIVAPAKAAQLWAVLMATPTLPSPSPSSTSWAVQPSQQQAQHTLQLQPALLESHRSRSVTHSVAIAAPHPNFTLVAVVDLSRLSSADASLSAPLAILVGRCRNLRAIDLSYCAWLRDKDLPTLAQAVALESLALNNCSAITASTLHRPLSALSRLKHLSLLGCTGISSLQYAFEAIAGPLVSIDLRNIFSLVDINNTLEYIFSRCRFTLRHLYIPAHFLSSDAFAILVNLSKPFVPLHTIHIDSPTSFSDTCLAYLSKHIDSLTVLSLSQASFLTSSSLGAFLGHARGGLLSNVDLSHIPGVDDVVIQTLASSTAKLETLKLNGCLRIGDSALAIIAHAFPGLCQLYLDYTCVTAVGVKMALLGNSYSTENIDINHLNLLMLKYLSLSNCQHVLGSDVHHLARVCWWEENSTADTVSRPVSFQQQQQFAALSSFASFVPPIPPSIASRARQSTMSIVNSSRIRELWTTTSANRESIDMEPLLNLEIPEPHKNGNSSSNSGGSSPRFSVLKNFNRSNSSSPAFSSGHHHGSVAPRSHSFLLLRGSPGDRNSIFSFTSTLTGTVSGGGGGVGGRMTTGSDGIKLDPTLVVFVGSRNVDRIRDL
ncbi:hypothetical protein HK100_000603 [Physocladia obscura]|uniref:F-box domain-containing protein n=1 Tax=Physocladia obscura TaxID=109957 RepID=A0AAD5XGI1_9FUNG|nr:hypothetical protein HK100_000603 [Physocladia obscura]